MKRLNNRILLELEISSRVPKPSLLGLKLRDCMLILGGGTKHTQERMLYFGERVEKQRCRSTQRGESLTFLDMGIGGCIPDLVQGPGSVARPGR